MAAGDIAGSSSNYQHEETSDLIMAEPTAFALPLGDNQYPDGTLSQYMANYHPWWGRFKSRTYPVPGNHEYHVSGAPGYFAYFGVPAYYAKDIGAWRWYFLNSEISVSTTSAQGQWLKADLAANPRICIGASWHKPYVSSYGGTAVAHSPNTYLKPLHDILAAAGADVLLVGHNHVYERHAKINGIKQFTVGTGGAGISTSTPSTIAPTSEKIIHSTKGVLKMTLADEGYTWQFLPIPGKTATDAGSLACSGAGSPPPPPPPEDTTPPPPPPPPSGVTLTLTKKPSSGQSYVLLDWAPLSVWGSSTVDVWRNATQGGALLKIKTGEANDGHLGNTRSDDYWPITYRYQVCKSGSTTNCSNTPSVSYP